MSMSQEQIKKRLNDLIDVCNINEDVDWQMQEAQDEWSEFSSLIKVYFRDILLEGKKNEY
tara:strand:+ start:69 stop:248 length:180 start_codon:yes stop_codon:yes gene_type:complete